METEFFDSHAHYNDEKFAEDREDVIEKIYESGVTKFVSAGYDVESSIYGVKLANEKEYIYTTVGLSPNDVKESIEETSIKIKKIEEILKSEIENKKIVAIGEIGLDYYWNKENKEID